MINGEKILRAMYPNLNDNQYQPAGIDLRLGKINKIVNDKGICAIVDGFKQLPKQVELEESAAKVGSTKLEIGYTLEPHIPYLAVVDKIIKINKDSAQIYILESSFQ